MAGSECQIEGFEWTRSAAGRRLLASFPLVDVRSHKVLNDADVTVILAERKMLSSMSWTPHTLVLTHALFTGIMFTVYTIGLESLAAPIHAIGAAFW